MNWQFLLSFALVFCLIFVIFMTLGFYVSYRRARKAQKQTAADPLTGRYFSRYIPDHLGDRYDRESVRQRIDKEKRRYSRMTKSLVAIPLGMFLIGSLFFAFRYQNFLYAPIVLTEREKSDISLKKYEWDEEQKNYRPHLHQIAKDLSKTEFVFLYNEQDNDWLLPSQSRSLTQVTKNAWKTWIEEQGAEWKACHWQNKDCWSPVSQRIYVILPGFWPIEELERLLNKKNSRLLVLGPPAQIFRQGTDHLVWQDLKFIRRDKPEKSQILLSGDKALSLGWDAATLLPIPRMDHQFRVEGPAADGYRLNVKGDLNSAPDVALYSKAVKTSKFVWTDFMPPTFAGSVGPTEEVNALASSIFRYLLDYEYSAVATWPMGKRFAAYLSLGAAENFGTINTYDDFLESLDIPLSPFIQSSRGEKERVAMAHLAGAGTLDCQGDDGQPLTQSDQQEQTHKIALCLKTVRELTGQHAKGLRPPEEKFNDDTLNSAKNLGLEFIVGGVPTQFSPKIIVDNRSKSRLLVISRAASNDFSFFIEHKLALQDVKKLILDEVEWLRLTGGIYFYEFHSHLLDLIDNRELIKHLNSWFKGNGSEVYLATPNEISNWWRFRANLQLGVQPSEKELTHFQPYRLSVTREGHLIKQPWKQNRKLSSEENDSEK